MDTYCYLTLPNVAMTLAKFGITDPITVTTEVLKKIYVVTSKQFRVASEGVALMYQIHGPSSGFTPEQRVSYNTCYGNLVQQETDISNVVSAIEAELHSRGVSHDELRGL